MEAEELYLSLQFLNHQLNILQPKRVGEEAVKMELMQLLGHVEIHCHCLQRHDHATILESPTLILESPTLRAHCDILTMAQVTLAKNCNMTLGLIEKTEEYDV